MHENFHVLKKERERDSIAFRETINNLKNNILELKVNKDVSDEKKILENIEFKREKYSFDSGLSWYRYLLINTFLLKEI